MYPNIPRASLCASLDSRCNYFPINLVRLLGIQFIFLRTGKVHVPREPTRSQTRLKKPHIFSSLVWEANSAKQGTTIQVN